jgi:hypothetical protein
MRSFCVASEVPATVEKVWERVTTPDGINDEIARRVVMRISQVDISPTYAVIRSPGDKLAAHCWWRPECRSRR